MNKIASRLTATTLAVGLALAGGSAFAADMLEPVSMPGEGGGYVSVFGGYSLGLNITGIYTTNGALFTAPFGAGYIIGGAIGTNLSDNVRGEIELSYASHAVSGNISASGVTFPTTGSESTLYLLGNVWFDLDSGSGFSPYIGGGIGGAYMMPNVTYAGAPGGTFNTPAFAPAAQFGAGVKFAVSDNMDLDLGYRARYVFNGALTGTGTSGGLSGVSYLDQSVQIGLDIGF
jgi:opacity protein-like surface antigen